MTDKKSNHYALEVLDDILHGTASPESIDRLSEKQLIDYLDEFQPDATMIKMVTFTGFLRGSKISNQLEFPSVLAFLPMLQTVPSQKLEWEEVPTRVRKALHVQNSQCETSEIYAAGKNQYLLTYPIAWRNLQDDQLKLSYFSVFLAQACTEIRKHIKIAAFSLESEPTLTLYIQKLQRELNNFSRAAWERGQFTDAEIRVIQSTGDLKKDMYILLYARIHSLLRFLEKNYLPHLDKSLPIPYKSAQLEGYNIRIKARNIARKLSAAKIDTALIHVLALALSDGIQNTIHHRPTYTEINYLEAVTSRLVELADSKDVCDESILRLMVKYNYNHPEALMYFIQCHQKGRGPSEKLKEMQKWIHQIPVCNDLIFDKRYDNLKTSLLIWISTEMDFSEEQWSPVQEATGEKIHLNLSVGQLALFIRLLSESGVITTANQQVILRAFSSIAKTPHADRISVNSLQNKYYQQDAVSVREIRYKLIEMLNLIREK